MRSCSASALPQCVQPYRQPARDPRHGTHHRRLWKRAPRQKRTPGRALRSRGVARSRDADLIVREATWYRGSARTLNMGVGFCLIVSGADANLCRRRAAIASQPIAERGGARTPPSSDRTPSPADRRSSYLVPTAVFASGNGSNLQAVIDATSAGVLPSSPLSFDNPRSALGRQPQRFGAHHVCPRAGIARPVRQ